MNTQYTQYQLNSSTDFISLNGLETQSFRFGRKNRPLGKDQSVQKTLDFWSEMLYNCSIIVETDMFSVTAW